MTRYLVPMLLLCVALMGCQSQTKQNVCDGFSRLTPSLDTSVIILRDDRPFANQVAAHNTFGNRQGCW